MQPSATCCSQAEGGVAGWVSRPLPPRALDTAIQKWYNPQKIRSPGLAPHDSRRGYGALLGPERFAQ